MINVKNKTIKNKTIKNKTISILKMLNGLTAYEAITVSSCVLTTIAHYCKVDIKELTLAIEEMYKEHDTEIIKH